jgi:Phage integrase family
LRREFSISTRYSAGLHGLRAHDLRHTFASPLRRAGAPQNTIAELLWHSSGSVTQHHSSGYLSPLVEAVEKITLPPADHDAAIAQLISSKLATLNEHRPSTPSTQNLPKIYPPKDKGPDP